MLWCQGCPHRGDRIFYPSSISCNDIHKTFHDIHFILLFGARLGLIQMIEFIAFIKQSRTATILVLGLMTAILRHFPQPTRKGNDTSTIIRQGKHDPILKGIKNRSSI